MLEHPEVPVGEDARQLTVFVVAADFIEQHANPRNRTWKAYERMYVEPRLGTKTTWKLSVAPA